MLYRLTLAFSSSILLLSITAYSQTFTFLARDTVISYSERDSTYAFRATISNLTSADLALVLSLTRVSYPDTNRQSSICTFRGCRPPQSGDIVIPESYAADYIDTLVQFDIYNSITDWSQGFPMPMDSELIGDYYFLVSVRSVIDPVTTVSYSMRLVFSTDGISVHTLSLPGSVQLLSAYPNPFNGTTRIAFSLASPGGVTIRAYDVLGRVAAPVYLSAWLPAGEHTTSWDAHDSEGRPLSSGTYYLQVRSSFGFDVGSVQLIR